MLEAFLLWMGPPSKSRKSPKLLQEFWNILSSTFNILWKIQLHLKSLRSNGIWHLYIRYNVYGFFSGYTTLLRRIVSITQQRNGPMDRKSRLRDKWVQWGQWCGSSEINGPHLFHGLLLSCCPIKTWCGATELQPGHKSNTSLSLHMLNMQHSLYKPEGPFCKLLKGTKYLGSVDSK